MIKKIGLGVASTVLAVAGLAVGSGAAHAVDHPGSPASNYASNYR